ncbi:MAG: glycosyl hydrolase [Candidatus Saccharimonadaceae bacterium]
MKNLFFKRRSNFIIENKYERGIEETWYELNKSHNLYGLVEYLNKTFRCKIKFTLHLFITLMVLSGSCQKISYLPKGYPDRSANLDVLPGFRNPPSGYGEVPFWWWTGDTLNLERMLEQVRELHRKGISGVQVNYSHLDTPSRMTDQEEPAIFSEDWWKVYSGISEECSKLGMGIGFSTYTQDWTRGAKNLFYELFYHKEELNAIELQQGVKYRATSGEKVILPLTSTPLTFIKNNYTNESKKFLPQRISVYAYPVNNNQIQQGGVMLDSFVTSDILNWTAPEGEWEIREFVSFKHLGTMNPLLPASGDTIVNGFYQQFEDNAGSAEGLNYFFNDELNIGMGKFAWSEDFVHEFNKRKGYDLFDFLPAMWEDMGDITAKVRIDYADVRMSLMEERYFIPIFNWHESRGLIYGCDPDSRGLRPDEFGDYFRAIRWYTAPGHDTPGGKADLIKGKVSSSIANLYQRPRVWLEGYHSLGWGATPAQLMYATRENFLYGCTLLNLHGLYYTTYGSHWEWAPPSYHFRMPYWEHMSVFLKYFDRLSYLMSQGHMLTDVAVIYPVAPYEAEMDPDKARDTAFNLGRALMAAGINFEFIDHESLANTVVENGLLKVKASGSEYKALVFANMDAVRWTSIEKAAQFATEGGRVYSVGSQPIASDRAGSNDAELEKMNGIAFKSEYRMNSIQHTVESIQKAFTQDVRGIDQTVRALHRKAGFRDVYMVMDARPGALVEFRAKGAVELWDPWTGKTTPLKVIKETPTGTLVELPLDEYEANIVVFNPNKKQVNPPANIVQLKNEMQLTSEWNVTFIPTMDNRWGDFQTPVTDDNKMIGLEARRFEWALEDEKMAKTEMLRIADKTNWEKKLNGYGTQFYVLGPIPKDVNYRSLEAKLVQMKQIDVNTPVTIDKNTFAWQPYDFSWRWGKEGDQGHQGWHGLKGTVTDDFLCLGKPQEALHETHYVEEIDGGRYYLWSSATVKEPQLADVYFSENLPTDNSHTSNVLIPATVYINGEKTDIKKGVQLKEGPNRLLIRYDKAGRGHFVLRNHETAQPKKQESLSMRWWKDYGIIPFDVSAGEQPAEWFRFITAPGTSAIRFNALGEVEAWIDGEEMVKERKDRYITTNVPEKHAVVTLRIKPDRAGISGGHLLPDPVYVETNGSGLMAIGDWSKLGILNNYSGGVNYSTQIKLSNEEAKSASMIDLGEVAGTVEVLVNGKKAGVRVAPPWKVDVSGLFKNGENKIEILVFNTLANHYQTVPSNYRGQPISGLLEPVKLLMKE